MPQLDTLYLPPGLRERWAEEADAYAEVREAAERGRVIVAGVHLNPSGTIGSWAWTLLEQVDRGVARLRADGLHPRHAIVLRTDVVAGAKGGAFEADFPWDASMRVEDMGDQGRRFLAAARQFGGPPRVENELGDWSARTGPLFQAAEAVGGVVVYFDNARESNYTREKVWRITAFLLDPDHPIYPYWLEIVAGRLHRRVLERFPGLAGLEFELHAKDAHYHVQDGELWWRPLGEFGPTGGCSGLSTWPTPYLRQRNSARRALQTQAIERAGVPCFTRFWIDRRLLPEYVEALGDREWCR